MALPKWMQDIKDTAENGVGEVTQQFKDLGQAIKDDFIDPALKSGGNIVKDGYQITRGFIDSSYIPPASAESFEKTARRVAQEKGIDPNDKNRLLKAMQDDLKESADRLANGFSIVTGVGDTAIKGLTIAGTTLSTIALPYVGGALFQMAVGEYEQMVTGKDDNSITGANPVYKQLAIGLVKMAKGDADAQESLAKVLDNPVNLAQAVLGVVPGGLDKTLKLNAALKEVAKGTTKDLVKEAALDQVLTAAKDNEQVQAGLGKVKEMAKAVFTSGDKEALAELLRTFDPRAKAAITEEFQRYVDNAGYATTADDAAKRLAKLAQNMKEVTGENKVGEYTLIRIQKNPELIITAVQELSDKAEVTKRNPPNMFTQGFNEWKQLGGRISSTFRRPAPPAVEPLPGTQPASIEPKKESIKKVVPVNQQEQEVALILEKQDIANPKAVNEIADELTGALKRMSQDDLGQLSIKMREAIKEAIGRQQLAEPTSPYGDKTIDYDKYAKQIEQLDAVPITLSVPILTQRDKTGPKNVQQTVEEPTDAVKATPAAGKTGNNLSDSVGDALKEIDDIIRKTSDPKDQTYKTNGVLDKDKLKEALKTPMEVSDAYLADAIKKRPADAGLKKMQVDLQLADQSMSDGQPVPTVPFSVRTQVVRQQPQFDGPLGDLMNMLTNLLSMLGVDTSTFGRGTPAVTAEIQPAVQPTADQVPSKVVSPIARSSEAILKFNRNRGVLNDESLGQQPKDTAESKKQVKTPIADTWRSVNTEMLVNPVALNPDNQAGQSMNGVLMNASMETQTGVERAIAAVDNIRAKLNSAGIALPAEGLKVVMADVGRFPPPSVGDSNDPAKGRC